MDIPKFYILKDSIIVMTKNDKTILWDCKEGWEIVADDDLLTIINIFSIPISKEAAYFQFKKSQNIQMEDYEKILNYLVEEGIITSHTPNNVKGFGGLRGMFQTPLIPFEKTLEGEWCDFAFIGMPYDLNVTNKPGARFAPDFIRKQSWSLYEYDSKEFTGIYDPVVDKHRLVNQRVVDCGNISANVFTRNGIHFDSLKEIVTKLSSKNIIPITIGGDHSITLPCIEGIIKSKGKIGIIHLDAHNDFSIDELNEHRESVHHSNFMDILLPSDNVEHVLQIGIRQLLPKKKEHEKVIQWTGKKILSQFGDLKSYISPEIPYYLTFDVDVLDPSIISATGTPLPNGFTHEELIKVFQVITTHAHIIGLDIVEFAPRNEEVEGLLISDLIFRLICMISEGKDEHLSKNS